MGDNTASSSVNASRDSVNKSISRLHLLGKSVRNTWNSKRTHRSI